MIDHWRNMCLKYISLTLLRKKGANVNKAILYAKYDITVSKHKNNFFNLLNLTCNCTKLRS